MTLELTQVSQQIEEMGKVLAGRAAHHQKTLPAARTLLKLYAHAQDELCRVAESENGKRLRCASPGEEPLDGVFPVPILPERVTIAAADGSQIFPDRHGMAFYYVLNVGSIVYRHGSGQPPDTATSPHLFFQEDKVFPEGRPISADQVSIERDLAEMRTLAKLALAEPSGEAPCLALSDGSLLPWLQRAAIPEKKQAQVLSDYLRCLDQLRAGGVTVSGFVSRPHSAEVVALLYLAQLEPEERTQLESLAETDYRGLTDRVLFGFLDTGERSALFARGTAANQDFREKGHTIFFFYLNTGTDIARVEIPEWVAHHPQRLALVHATISGQCRVNNGYPYVLTRADELAVILGPEREVLESMISQAMLKNGLPMPELSRKAQQKQVARWRSK